MPRPGPRPYECVRRAWHSERHQPMRGSIISQIFRVVTEAHSSTTRKNREWQEKLPTVVLKAEEIMYSKANSEAEYLDTDTLWDRLNDAIDTIIRKEETVETGEYLQPCIEAALVLGCVVVKASRSERLSNPRSYLHHHQDSAPRATALSDKLVHEKQPIHPSKSLAPNNQLSIARPTIQTANNGSRLQPNIEHNVMPTPVVYPLHYSTSCYQNSSSHAGIHIPSQNPSNIIVGTPVGWSSAQPAHLSTTRDLFSSMVGACSSDKPKQDFQADTSRLASTTGCDLSLSLGRNFNLSGTEGRFQCEYEAGGSGRFQEHNFDPKVRFLPRQSSDDYFEGELQDVSTIGRKRKLPNSCDTGEGSIDQQPRRRPIEFLSQIRWPGL